MRVIELSNHPGDMLTDVTRQRQATQQHKRGFWSRLLLIFTAAGRTRRTPRAQTNDIEQKIRAGIAGEQLVATELGRTLGDDWTLLRGYRNRRGEIDHLLLGPRGLWAIEVKNINATVYIDGDRWRADKYDNYGNLVEQRPIEDRTGRSPGEQLNEPADELERFLRERGQRVTVQRVVILTHKKSRVGPRRHPTVQVGTSASYALRLISGSKTNLDDRQRADVQRLIRRDHDFNDRRRRYPRTP